MKHYLFAVILAASCVAAAQKPISIPAPIAKIYEMQSADFAKGDWDHFCSFYDAGYIAFDPKGKKSDLKVLVDGFHKGMKGTSNRSLKMNFTHCNATPTKIEVSYVARMSFLARKRQIKNKEIGTDTWVKKGADWKETKTVDSFFGPDK